MTRPKPWILGVDPATNTGFALGQPGGTPQLITKRWKVGDNTIEDRFGRALYYMNGILSGIDAVAIEAPIHIVGTTSYDTTKLLLGLHAIFTGVVKSRQIPLLIVEARTWRKAFEIKGDDRLALKAASIAQCRRLGWSPKTDDQADAAGIWFWACGQFSPWANPQTGPLFATVNNYDANKDFAASYDECLREARERKAAGGPGWTPKEAAE